MSSRIGRAELPWPLWRRLAPLLGTTVIGVFLGARIMIAIPERAILLALAGMILVFLASTRLRIELRVSPEWESWLGPLTGLVGGVLNGVTNVFSPIGAIYLLALQFEKRNFVKAMASIFLAAKISHLAAISRWGLYTPTIRRWSSALTAVALAAFWVGLKTQDRVRQETFVPSFTSCSPAWPSSSCTGDSSTARLAETPGI
jgi:hypothetical protein